MSADPDLDHLDARGRAAAAGLRAAVDERAVPGFDPDLLRIDLDADPTPPRHRRRWQLAAVAALVLVLGAAAALALRVGGEGDTTDRVGTEEPGRHVLGEVPEGYALLQVLDGATETDPDALLGIDATATVYGASVDDPRVAVAVLPDPTDGDTAVESDVGTTTMPAPTTVVGSPGTTETTEQPEATAPPEAAAPPGTTGPPGTTVAVPPETTTMPAEVETDDEVDGATPPQVEGMEEITVAGRRAWDFGAGIGGGTVVVEDGDALVVVIGAADAVEAVASGVTADGETASVAADALPEGWQELGDVPLIDALGGFTALRADGVGDGWSVVYAPDGPDADERISMLSLTTQAGDALSVALPSLLADGSEAIEVQGAPGVLAWRATDTADADLTWWTVSWQERPGEVVRLTATGAEDMGREEVLALAEGVRRIGPDEVAALRQEAARHGVDSGAVEVVGEGAFSDGTPWTLVFDAAEEGMTGLTVRTSAPSGSSSGFAQATSLGPDGEPEPDTSALPGGVTIEGPASGGSYSWAYGAASDEVATVELRDGDGAVLAEAPVVASGPYRGWVLEVPASADLNSRDAQGPTLAFVALAADGRLLQQLGI